MLPVAMTIWLSSYDWWSNSPPGAGIEYARDYGYPTVHDSAGGTGTYADPVTFAAPRGFLRPGARIYIARFRKYFILEDLCSTCTAGPQADLWVSGVTRSQQASRSPSDIVNLWEKQPVTAYPPQGLPVSTAPLRDAHA